MKRSTKRKAIRSNSLAWTVVHVLGFLVYLYLQTTTDRPPPAYPVPFVGDTTVVSALANSG